MKQIKFLLTMLWGATLTYSWNMPHLLADAQTFEMHALGWIIPGVYSFITIIAGIVYCHENWHNNWGK